MRQTVAKGMRRDLRRAMGSTAVQTLDNHTAGIRLLQRDMTSLAADHAEQKQALTKASARIEERITKERETADKRYSLSVDHQTIIGGSFLQRLLWLLKGCECQNSSKTS